MKLTRTRWIAIGAAVFALLLVVPVRFELKCEYGFDYGSCTDHGQSIVGTPIPPAMLSALLVVLVVVAVLGPLAYLGWRLDRRSRGNRQL